jgi:putative thioredoxin
MTVIEVTDFNQQVIAESHQRPVVVDFYADWCQPCRILGPMLENAAAAGGGKWLLAKVNTDAHQQIAYEYYIQGIPAVKMFFKGQVIDEFVGVMPDYQLKKWLENALPKEDPFADKIIAAQQAIDRQQIPQAIELLEEVLYHDPDHISAALLLARIIVFENPARVIELLKGVRADHEMFAKAESLISIARFISTNSDDLPEKPCKQLILQGMSALKQQQFTDAINHLITAITIDKKYADELARKVCVAIFIYLGPTHPVTVALRKKFDSSLYV